MRAPGQFDRGFHFLHDALGQMPRFIAVADADQDAKLIATKTRDHIFMAAHRAFDMARQHREQLVAGVMPEAVIDTLEMVDIEENCRHHAFALGFFCDFLGEDLIETAAIEQAGQGVIMRHLLQRGAGLVQLAEQGR